MEPYGKARQVMAQMILAEKASLCSEKDFSHLKGNPRLGLREEMIIDGPNVLHRPDSLVEPKN